MGGWRFGWLFAVVWLVYLLNPLEALLDDAEGWRQLLGLGCLAVFVIVYVSGIVFLRQRRMHGTLRRSGWLSWVQILASSRAPSGWRPAPRKPR